MTARTLEAVTDMQRFLTPELLAQVKNRQPAMERSYLTDSQASKVKGEEWLRAYARVSRAFLDLIQTHDDQNTELGIAAQLVDRVMDLHSFGVQVFVGPNLDQIGIFRRKGVEILQLIWNSMNRVIIQSLEEAEPLLRAELQDQLDAYLSMVDQANTETTAERRRADLAEKTVVQLKTQHLNEIDTAVWRAGQATKTELKTETRRAEKAEEQAEHARTELSLLREEVARLSARERQLAEDLAATESRLADAQHNLLMTSFRKEVKEKPVEQEKLAEIPSTFVPLEGMALAVYLRQRGHPVWYDPSTRTLDRGAVSLDVIALCVQDCAAIPDKTAFLREHLRAEGLLA